ncbi:hypothetical protein NIES4075_67970 [Tolypothrix sp. NIES-4075]|uniref:hypothetical protein n=1 Tax=Tolypothrix sp. NIES-4075 TaxID=2005459 RepID=UPI000B5C2B83|nr:hypothetical protein [Tolypothrix sp. NIES-4075]GAX45776.1 hypothetical protein NIES4075_67970 [Tolypothrix sp. NIES-4075]
MSAKGFGQPQPTKTDKLVEQVVRYCKQRHPEALDQIFDNLPVGRTVQEYQRLNQQVLAGTTNALRHDIDSLAWFCAYIASEINRSEDNHKPHHPIALLSKLLIKHGMQPFTDFSPYPGCRLIIINTEKFAALPEQVQKLVQSAFDVMESTGKQAIQINNALLEELVVMVE